MLLAAAFTCILPSAAWAQGSITEAEEQLRAGQFAECAAAAKTAIEANAWAEAWRHLLIKAELAQGHYPEALAAAQEAIDEYRTSISLRLLAYEAFLYNNQSTKAQEMLAEIGTLALRNPERYNSAESRVALGRLFMMQGADARKVLEQFFDYAQKQAPSYLETYLASAELALSKEDYALAAQTLQKAPAYAATREPQYHYLLAKAFASSDPEKVVAEIEAALAINPRHVPTLLLQSDKLIDAEQYAAAEDLLEKVLEVNPLQPQAWAYKAVIAHLRNELDVEAECRAAALAHWTNNPEVDWLIGRKLSQKYRFAEGSAYQRRSLAFDPNYLPAKIQLSQDLLRLGDEAAGWQLAQEVAETDGYNVQMYNLVTLHDEIAGFRTIAADGFLLRMDEREAQLYGQQALALLRRAKATLCAKYDVPLEEPIIVEIFPRQRDFAVRTFGLPGAEGYLGVCFGRVITANSPASQGESPSNWEAVLWHEFCHVVTLHKTHNKMPRWLSEGISVYEETQEDPAWGQPLIPIYRDMLLGEELTPLSKLSSAFMSPKSALHLQFAYFESELAVEFLIDTFGFEKLTAILDDLGQGKPLETALPLRTGEDWAALDRAFEGFAHSKAEATAKDATWEQPELPRTAGSAEIGAWLEENPNSFPGLLLYAAALIQEKQFAAAKTPLEKLLTLYPEYVAADNAYSMLAAVHRELGETNAEKDVLRRLIARDSDALNAYARLMEIAQAEDDAHALLANAQRYLAVNPLVPAPHRALASAAEKLHENELAIRGLSALSLLDDVDPSLLHFRLAELHYEQGNRAESRRYVLQALEEAPRFREAHALLLQLAADMAPALRAPDSGKEGGPDADTQQAGSAGGANSAADATTTDATTTDAAVDKVGSPPAGGGDLLYFRRPSVDDESSRRGGENRRIVRWNTDREQGAHAAVDRLRGATQARQEGNYE